MDVFERLRGELVAAAAGCGAGLVPVETEGFGAPTKPGEFASMDDGRLSTASIKIAICARLHKRLHC
ncbi:hypothetical protein JCM9533A_57130 [Catenuloplanes niger JCM 9533]